MRFLMLFIYLLLVLLGISFAALNATSVKVNLYFTIWTLPVSLLIVIILGLGILLGFIFFIGKYYRLKKECNRVKNQLKLTEKEIKNLRDIPLKNAH